MMLVENNKINVPTDVLRAFVAVCEFRSLTKAAQLLQLTQQGVTEKIKKLETIIGRRMIDRDLSGINLTRRGSEVLKSAKDMLSLHDELVSEIGPERQLRVVTLGVPNLFAARMLPSIVTEIRARVPNVELQICCDNCPNLLRMLRLGYLDAAFVYGEAADMAEAMCTWTERIGWVKSRSLVAQADRPIPLISSPNVLKVDRIAIEALKRSRQPYRIVFSADDFTARLAAAAAGLGYMPLTMRLVPSYLGVEEQKLPPLGRFMVGIFVSDAFRTKDPQPLVAALEAIAKPAPNLA
jgi:DNA-binding transcriptional LysR family regulator